jgi:hypothetical protein
MPEFDVQPLLPSTTVAVHDVCCRGACRHRGAEECAASTQLVFPYRGLFLRHVGSTQSVADANHVLFFNAACRAIASGRDIYAVTAPVLVEALQRLLDGHVRGNGALAADMAFDARDFLAALAPRAITVTVEAGGR